MSYLHPYSSVEALFSAYLQSRKNELSFHSQNFYTRTFKNCTPDEIKVLPLCEFKEEHFTDLFRHLNAVFSDAYVSRASMIYTNMFELALLKKLIHSNPCHKIKYKSEQAYTKKILTDEELSCIVKLIQYSPLVNMYGLAITTGMRQGELLGLSRESVLCGGTALCVNQYLTYCRARHKYKLSTDISRYGLPRTIILSHPAQFFLRNQLMQVDLWKNSYGWYSPDSLIFHDPDGKCLQQSFINQENIQIRHLSGVPGFNIQLLRENYCINALRRGVNHKALQQYMGYIMPQQILHMYYCAVGGEQREVASSTQPFYSQLEEHSHVK